jgi:hypothetical protein
MAQRELGDLEYFGELVKMFGISRSAQLMGYCVFWSLQGKGQRGFAELRRELQEIGLSRSAVYAIMADLAKFRDHVAELEGRGKADVPEVVERLGRLQAAA